MVNKQKKSTARWGPGDIPTTVRFNVIDLELWKRRISKDSFYNDEEYLDFIRHSIVQYTVEHIVVLQELLLVCRNCKFSDHKGAAELLKKYAFSDVKTFRFILMDQYQFLIPRKKQERPYHYNLQRYMNNFHKILPHIYMGAHYASSSPDSAVQLRYMISNRSIKYKALEFLRDNRLTIDMYNKDTTEAHQMNIIRWLGALMKYPLFTEEVDFWSRATQEGQKHVYVYKDDFMKARGFVCRRSFPTSYTGKTQGRWMYHARGDPSKLASETAYWNHVHIFSRLEYGLDGRFHYHLKSLLEKLPTRVGVLELINYTPLKGQNWDDEHVNWFSYICSGAIFPRLIHEMKAFNERRGKSTQDFLCVLVMIILKYGYCDIAVGPAMRELEKLVAVSLTGFFVWDQGPFEPTSDVEYSINICRNRNHTIKIYGFSNQYRRAVYQNTTTDGICCYYHNYRKCFPTKVVGNLPANFSI
mmetsp:Transcript_15575/g.17594  ORF Transcript_15575/g.17594 Transcript_15575/m.17594 type:complete len:471 (+) Transcript_15575:128-1540(+)